MEIIAGLSLKDRRTKEEIKMPHFDETWEEKEGQPARGRLPNRHW